MFDRHEAIQLLHAVVRLARNENHEKAEEYAASADEIRTRALDLENDRLQRLFLGLLGDPVRAKIAKEAGTILKSAGKASEKRTVERARNTPYNLANVQCYRCLRWGHFQRTCRNPRGRARGRGGRY